MGDKAAIEQKHLDQSVELENVKSQLTESFCQNNEIQLKQIDLNAEIVKLNCCLTETFVLTESFYHDERNLESIRY